MAKPHGGLAMPQFLALDKDDAVVAKHFFKAWRSYFYCGVVVVGPNLLVGVRGVAGLARAGRNCVPGAKA